MTNSPYTRFDNSSQQGWCAIQAIRKDAAALAVGDLILLRRASGVNEPGKERDWHGHDIRVRDIHLRAGCDDASPA